MTALAAITQELDLLGAQSTQIAVAAEHQSMVAEDVSKRVEEIASQTAGMESAAKDNEQATSKLTSSADQLTGLVGRFRLLED